MRKVFQKISFVFLALIICSSLCWGAAKKAQDNTKYPIIQGYEIAPGKAFPLVLLDDLSEFNSMLSKEENKCQIKNTGKSPTEIRVNSDTTTQLQNEEQICVNPTNSLNLVANWRDFRLGYRQVAVGYSFDGGATWTDQLIVEPNYQMQSDPGMTVDKNGNFYCVVLSFTGNTNEPNGLYVFKSINGGVTWGPGVTVINQAGPFEDKELIACDRTNSPYSGNLYVTWARFGSNIDIMLCRSTDGNLSWLAPQTISDTSYVQWPTPAVGPNGEVYIAWVNLSSGNILFDRSLDGGVTWGTDITAVNTYYGGSGTIHGEITVFNYPAMDVDITGGVYNGNIYIAYMDYPADSPTDTDLFFVKSTNGGTTWSSPIRINDDAWHNGCDQFHPWISIDEEGVISVVWLDRRLDPTNNLLYDCYMAKSFNGGDSFWPNWRVSTVSSDPTNAKAGLLGEYIGLASSGGYVFPLWTDIRNLNQDAYFCYDLIPVELFSFTASAK